MKKNNLWIAVIGFLIITVFVSSTWIFANDKPENRGRQNNDNRNGRVFNPDNELSKSKCDNVTGNPVINVIQKVENDVDSGFGSNAYFPGEANYWNVEGYMRHIKVWSTGKDSWCAIVTYENGDFNAFYKQTGPGGIGFIGADVNGRMSGGYRATFNGTLLSSPLWSTTGNVGVFNYDCDLHANCPGRISWLEQYFGPGYSNFDQPWWGWKYVAGTHGTWINASTGSSGNIL